MAMVHFVRPVIEMTGISAFDRKRIFDGAHDITTISQILRPVSWPENVPAAQRDAFDESRLALHDAIFDRLESAESGWRLERQSALAAYRERGVAISDRLTKAEGFETTVYVRDGEIITQY